MPRGAYSVVTNVDRERLITCFESDGDWLTLAQNLNIKRQTASSVIKKFRETGQREALRRGGSRIKCDQEMLNFIVNCVEENPAITLAEIKRLLELGLPNKPHISEVCISRHLDGQLISLKNLRNVPRQWNEHEIKVERRLHMEWLMNEAVANNRNLVFIDEFGINCWTARTKGRAAVGQPAVRITGRQRGKNLTFCLAISPQFGFVHANYVVGGFTAAHFSDFMSELDQLLMEEECIFLCDNARPHSPDNPPVLSEGHDLRYLPRYSPFVNCAEMAGSSVKAVVKQALATPQLQLEIDDRQAAAAAHQTLHQRRIQILRRELQGAIETLTQHKCLQFFNHILRYTPRCLAEEDIFD